MHTRTTVTLDDGLLVQAQQLGGSEPDLQAIPRRRSAS